MFKINEEIKNKIVLALDVDTLQEAKDLVEKLKPYVGVFKVGLQLYTRCGNEIIKFMNENNLEYFLDIKLNDIPNTVEKASKNVIENGAYFFNVHCLGGFKMLSSSVKGAYEAFESLKKRGRLVKKPIVLGVTVLTSLNDEVFEKEFRLDAKTDVLVENLALLAKKANLSGVVASCFEAKRIKELCGDDFIVLCPGIRPKFANSDDQKRLATPKFAFSQGADFIVLGRAVTANENPILAIEKIYEEIEGE